MSLFEMKCVVLVEVASNLWMKGMLYCTRWNCLYLWTQLMKQKLPGGNHGLLIFTSQQHATFSKMKNKL